MRAEPPIVTQGKSGNVCISGFTAAGKSTHAHLLAGHFGLQYVSASQVLLNQLGKSPVQRRDHWVTNEARASWSRENYLRVDEELLTIEQDGASRIFDTLTMPWLASRDSFRIWLDSSIESRVSKAVVSHQEDDDKVRSQIRRLIERKDAEQRSMLSGIYGFDLAPDPERFDLVLDISDAIEEPTWTSSVKSIRLVDAPLRAAVGWYLTREDAYRKDFLSHASSPSVRVLHAAAGLS